MSDALREALESAYVEPATEEVNTDIAADAPVAEEPIGRSRDDRGRFSAKDTAVEPAAPAAAPAAPIPDQGSAPAPEPALQPLAAPDRWSAEWKTKFSALPRDAQQLLLDREGEYNKGFTQTSQELASLKKQYEPIETLIAPRRQAWQAQGANEAQMMEHLFGLSDFADKDPAGFIQWFAKERGIALDGQPAQQPDSALDQRLRALETGIQQEKQATLQRQIDDFASNHEHFEAVRQDMGALMQAGRAKDLDSAYEMAVWANPQTREALLKAQQEAAATAQQAEEAQRQEKAREAANKALKTAGTQLSTKAPLNAGAGRPSSLREALAKTADKINLN